ncbi:TPA: hypothetical protein O3H02_004274 [Salmonella enterica subsp. enterica serovar Saintpaul str. CFSAN004144]|nr:hypothetical protein [Salmonella enterica subsp. enterica serovar Saintpaul str. CFSAN004144]
MENIIQPCNTEKIRSSTQNSMESITDILNKKMNGCSPKKLKDKEDELANIYYTLLLRHLLPTSLSEKVGKDRVKLEAPLLSRKWIATNHFPGRTTDGEQVRALLSKRIKEKGVPDKHHPYVLKSAGARSEGNVKVERTDVGITPEDRLSEDKKEKVETADASVSQLNLHPVKNLSGQAPIPLIQHQTETPVLEKQLSFQVPPEMTKEGEALIYRFRTWGRDASVSIQPQNGGAMVLQPSDTGVGLRLVAHWPVDQERQWYLSSDEKGEQKPHQHNNDDEENT